MDMESNFTNESLALSEVLKELGINEEILSLRRKVFMLKETVLDKQNKIEYNLSWHFFGSQIEGTTTYGLQPDSDILASDNTCNVIENLNDWKPGVINLLMVYDRRPLPGYCMLQRLSALGPLPEIGIFNKHDFRDDQGRILLKNTAIWIHKPPVRDPERQGPAFHFPFQPGIPASDLVIALPCALQIRQIRDWLSQTNGAWPTEDLKKRINNARCLVAPVSSRGNTNEYLEWRISTSFAERELMLSLNVTQLQVYVLMKMLLKTQVNCSVEEENHISSFMCKNVLLRCIQNTGNSGWQSHRLLPCLVYCLSELHENIRREHCPHFIITSNNLMYRRFTPSCKRQFAENFQHVFHHLSRGKMPISIDDIESRFNVKLQQRTVGVPYMENETCQNIRYDLLRSLAIQVSPYALIDRLSRVANRLTVLKELHCSLPLLQRSGNDLQRTAARLLSPVVCGVLGSLLASESIRKSNTLSPEATILLSVGFNSDIASYRLKLASALYSVGNLNRAESLLRNVEDMCDFKTCSPACRCSTDRQSRTTLTRRKALASITDVIKISQLIYYCVIFLPDERHCVPKELLYEMYRSTPNDLRHRSPEDVWMDWAVVDSLSYLYFLQYNVYGRLQKRDEQKTALKMLFLVIWKEPNLAHPETAWNLLGLCMEQEERWDGALDSYRISLRICPTNNAAKFHIGKLLYLLYKPLKRLFIY